jgi:hyperosmotically inducible periplasmic protein
MKSATFVMLLALSLAAAFGPSASATPQNNAMSQKGTDRVVKEVRHELVMLPYYGVFDFLSYKVSPEGTVTLMGAVSRPTLKSDAENVVKKIEGVERVDNQIEVLPLSPNDDGIRRATFRTVYSSPQLSRYSWQSVQSIHIIVRNGNVTLEGYVDTPQDKQVAEIQAKSVPGVFSVTDNLQVIPGK